MTDERELLPLRLAADDAPDLRLVLVNRADNVALVRRAVGGVAEAVGLDPSLLSDIKTVVSESCNNVVLHAYEGEEGPMEVYLCPDGRQLEVIVRDQGQGIQPRPVEPDAQVQGVGLSLIQALSDSVEFRGAAGEGTEVRMAFHADRDLEVELSGTGNGRRRDVRPPAGDAIVSIAASGLVGPVLGSIVTTVAARAGFSVERVSEAQLLTDAIAAHVRGLTVGRHVHAGLEELDGALTITVGPLVDHGAERLVQASSVGGLDPLIERLADEVAGERSGDGELLRLRLGRNGAE